VREREREREREGVLVARRVAARSVKASLIK